MAFVVAVLAVVAVLLGWPSAGARLARLTASEERVRGDGDARGGVIRTLAGHTTCGPVSTNLIPLSLDDASSQDSSVARDVGAPLVLDLVAAALAAGAPPHRAMETVGVAVQGALGRSMCEVAARLRLGSEWDAAWQDAPRRLDPLRRTLRLAATTGAPASALLRDAAEDLRRRDSRMAQAAAGRLGVRMVLPLGLCSLPAFVAWSVVPVVISLAGRVLEG